MGRRGEFPGKKNVNAWLSDAEYAFVRGMADREKVTLTMVLRTLIRRAMARAKSGEREEATIP